MFETGRILTLDNNEKYVIVCSCKYENTDYVYIVDLNDEQNTKICIYKDNTVIEVTDEDVLKTVEGLLLANLENS